MKRERSDCHFWNSGSTCTPRVYHRIFFHVPPLVLKWATDEITCLGKMQSPNGRAPYGSRRFLNMDSLLVMKLPWAASKFKGNFLLLCWLCSSSNFVYSNHVGVMQWAHNSSAAALSHQVSDLRMWSCENVNYTTWGPGCVSSTCDIRRRLFNIWYCRVSSCHHDTSIGLTNSMEIPWCAVLFWNTQVRIQYPVICPVSWVKLYPQFPHLATTLVSWTTATHHLENNLRRPTPPFRWLLGTCLVSQRKTLEPGLLHLTSVVHSQITNFN